MKKCFKCGKEIDIIAKNPSHIVYCRECSEELLNKMNANSKPEKTKCRQWFLLICYIFPGIYQLKNRDIISGAYYIFNTYLLTIFWMVLFYFEYSYGFIDDRIKGINLVFTFFIVINLLLSYIKNTFDIIGEQ